MEGEEPHLAARKSRHLREDLAQGVVSHGQIRGPKRRQTGLGPGEGKAEDPSRRKLAGHDLVKFPGIETVQLGALGFRQGHEDDVIAVIRGRKEPAGVLIDEVDPGVPGEISHGREEVLRQSHQIGVQFHVSRGLVTVRVLRISAPRPATPPPNRAPAGAGVFQQAQLDLVFGGLGSG